MSDLLAGEARRDTWRMVGGSLPKAWTPKGALESMFPDRVVIHGWRLAGPGPARHGWWAVTAAGDAQYLGRSARKAVARLVAESEVASYESRDPEDWHDPSDERWWVEAPRLTAAHDWILAQDGGASDLADAWNALVGGGAS